VDSEELKKKGEEKTGEIGRQGTNSEKKKVSNSVPVNNKFIYICINLCVLGCVYIHKICASKPVLLLNNSYPRLKVFSWRHVPVI